MCLGVSDVYTKVGTKEGGKHSEERLGGKKWNTFTKIKISGNGPIRKLKAIVETHEGTKGTNLDSLEEFVEHGRLSSLDMDMSLESPVELGELLMAHGRTAISFKDLMIGRTDQRSPSDDDDLDDLFDEQLFQ
ncbi:hypothetical protein Pint_10730 [Pistacia integerrima]|uniref:Uncharacterized protein n=1 Tax=Pistacia integerrima TaxID=434235 RepID=A0ACC0XGW7_9ROSI|nr:hypothetical protein Pint_10730 [Pistacia integerrima]